MLKTMSMQCVKARLLLGSHAQIITGHHNDTYVGALNYSSLKQVLPWNQVLKLHSLMRECITQWTSVVIVNTQIENGNEYHIQEVHYRTPCKVADILDDIHSRNTEFFHGVKASVIGSSSLIIPSIIEFTGEQYSDIYELSLKGKKLK